MLTIAVIDHISTSSPSQLRLGSLLTSYAQIWFPSFRWNANRRKCGKWDLFLLATVIFSPSGPYSLFRISQLGYIDGFSSIFSAVFVCVFFFRIGWKLLFWFLICLTCELKTLSHILEILFVVMSHNCFLNILLLICWRGEGIPETKF